ncbi:MAG: hypothetical protein JWR20_2820 [Marmoricola sp.]|nr:hypothetical protein [Marmoricola sp.]
MRSLPDPGFAGDDGSTPRGVAAALAAYDSDPDGLHLATLALLQDARVLVPVVAVLGEVEHDAQGLAHDKTSDMAAVLLRGRDGRTALLGFTGTDSLRAWDPEARPVPVSLADAARAARQDDAAAMVLDVAGPVRFVVESEDLHRLAEGLRLREVGEQGQRSWAWVQEL